jgi:hypothetical protein
LRVTAIQHFHPAFLARAIRPGEVLEAEAELAREWLGLGFVRMTEAAEDATRAPGENAIKAPEEKAIRRPRSNAARAKR